jgi:hypothetical protein
LKTDEIKEASPIELVILYNISKTEATKSMPQRRKYRELSGKLRRLQPIISITAHEIKKASNNNLKSAPTLQNMFSLVHLLNDNIVFAKKKK